MTTRIIFFNDLPLSCFLINILIKLQFFTFVKLIFTFLIKNLLNYKMKTITLQTSSFSDMFNYKNNYIQFKKAE